MNFYHCKRRERKKPCAQLSHGLSIVKSFGRDRVVEVDSAECSNRDRITQKKPTTRNKNRFYYDFVPSDNARIGQAGQFAQ